MEIEAKHLTKFYGKQKAVDDVSFRLGKGELLGFLGPNGAGKSTTMRMLCCYISSSAGDVLLNGTSVFEDPVGYKKRIGYLPENNPLYPDMFIVDYLDYVAALQGMPVRLRSSRIKEMLEYCGLEKEKHKKNGELSKGYRQRVGIAQAMIHDPEFLILDEPTSGLDPNQIIEIREFIKNIGKEKAILLSTHNLTEVEASCERVVIINEGRIIADDSSQNLKVRAKGAESISVELEAPVGENAVAASLRTLNGVESVTQTANGLLQFRVNSNDGQETRRAIYRLCNDKSWTLTELYSHKENLEDVFRRLTFDEDKKTRQ